VIDALFARLPLEGRFRVRLNNRKVLTGFLEALSLSHASVEVLRCIDKLEKVGRAAVEEELGRLPGVGAEEARRVVDFAEQGQVKGDLAAHNEALLERLTELVADSELGRRGVEELRGVRALAVAGGVPEGRLQLDPSIARGLDYYTGTVYETFLDDLPAIGSCCSGGRYDDLASLYTKERLPGVGASLGLDRLLTALDELGRVEHRSTAAAVFVPFFDADRGPDYLALAARLRAAGLGVELYPEPRKLKAQLRYADRRGHRLAAIVGGDEWARGVAQLKDLGTQESEEVALDDLPAACARRLGRA
jgi:histidyl-tRNA synthetase